MFTMSKLRCINLIFTITFLSNGCTGFYVSSITAPIQDSETHYVSNDGIKTYYHVIGDSSNPPIVFLHGILAFTNAYRDIIEILAERYYVIGIDMAGHGKSSISPGLYSYFQIAEDVIRVTNHIGINRFHVVGHSAGGIVLLSLGLHFPNKMIKGVSIASFYDREGINFRDEQDDYITQEGFRDNVEGRNNRLIRFYNKVYKKLGEEEKFMNTKKVLVNSGEEMFPDISESELKKIYNPILVIVAEADSRIKPQHTKKMSQLLPNSTLFEVPDAKHFNIVKRKKNLNVVTDKIFNFLQ